MKGVPVVVDRGILRRLSGSHPGFLKSPSSRWLAPPQDRVGGPGFTASAMAVPCLKRVDVLLVVAAATAWTLVLGAAAIWRHNRFLSHRFDLGNMVQAVWSTAAGRPLEMTDAETGEQIVRLGAHVDPILILLVPFWWLYSEPETLLVVQAGALAAGVYPVVRLALVHTRHRLVAGLCGIWYLTFPWVIWNVFDEFHPVTLAIPLLLYAIWFLDQDRLRPFCVAAILAMSTGELIGLTVAALGVWYLIVSRRVLPASAIVAAGAAWTAICLVFVVPAFNAGQPSRYYERFEGVGGSPTGLIHTVLTDPVAVLVELAQLGDLKYVLWLVLPTAFLALLNPVALVTLVPQLFVNLTADWPAATKPMYHYAAPIVPIVIAATVMAIGRFSRGGRVLAVGVALAASAVVLALHIPHPGAQGFVFPPDHPPERRAAMREALAAVPPGVPVTATNRLGAHLSARRVIQLFPEQAYAEWAILDTLNPWLPRVSERADMDQFLAFVDALDDDPQWTLVFDREGVRVYRRADG